MPGLLNRDLAVRSTSLRGRPVWRSPPGAATACCLSDAVRAPAHVACGFAQGSSGKDSRAPGCPLSHNTKQLSMDLCVSSLALAASLTLQFCSNWSPGRLPDLGWRVDNSAAHVGPSSVPSNGAGATIRATGVTAGAPEEPLRTAVRAETAKSGHTIHPAICRSDAPELGVVVVACGGHGKAFRKNEHSCPK